MFQNTIISQLLQVIEKYSDCPAFCFKGNRYYTYSDFAHSISGIRSAVKSSVFENKKVGLVINDDLETYSSIFALWMQGCCYVPLHPHWPSDRLGNIIDQVGIDLILDSSGTSAFDLQVLNTSQQVADSFFLNDIVCVDDSEPAYILFTSGSTGTPKGVPVMRRNLAAFYNSFCALGLGITSKDRCLQAFDLTFDLSVNSYLTPLLSGACLYTVPDDVIKYMYISELLEEQDVTYALMAPSVIKCLRPYFEEIELPSLRYSLFCGEALPEDVTAEWSQCVPNARIFNVYGPTENTIFCTAYEYQRHGGNKTYNGVLSIGRDMQGCMSCVVDDDEKRVGKNAKGELCLSGGQLFGGYWKNDAKTAESFFTDGDDVRFYKTGDICFQDDDGDLLYCGRKDYQVKIQGFRVELGEIEHVAKRYLKDKEVVCVVNEADSNFTRLILYVESDTFDTKPLVDYLRSELPSYMIPSSVVALPTIPLNANGKVDRNLLKNMIK